MKAKSRFAVFALCASLLLSACGAAWQALIVGKWEVEGAPMKMTAEFNADGTAKVGMLGQTLQGTYKLIGDDQLEWTMNGMTTKAKISVTATELELTNSENQTIKYARK